MITFKSRAAEIAQQLKALTAEDPSWFPAHVCWWLLTACNSSCKWSQAFRPPQALRLTRNIHTHIAKTKSCLKCITFLYQCFCKADEAKNYIELLMIYRLCVKGF